MAGAQPSGLVIGAGLFGGCRQGLFRVACRAEALSGDRSGGYLCLQDPFVPVAVVRLGGPDRPVAARQRVREGASLGLEVCDRASRLCVGSLQRFASGSRVSIGYGEGVRIGAELQDLGLALRRRRKLPLTGCHPLGRLRGKCRDRYQCQERGADAVRRISSPTCCSLSLRLLCILCCHLAHMCVNRFIALVP